MSREPITAKTRLLGVAGWPVEHSLSPRIHNAAIEAAGLDCVYLAFAVPPDLFEEAVRGFAAVGMAGLNCTVPHKQAALALCDAASDEARMVGAVNTIHFRREGLYGTNTDVEGFVETIRQDAGFDFSEASVVQFGAGGAGRGMALGAVKAGARRLTIVNRTFGKAVALADELGGLYPKADIAALPAPRCKSKAEATESEPEGEEDREAEAVRKALAVADLVTNSTSLGLAEGDPMPCRAEDLAPRSLVFDAAYTARRSTAWLRAACGRGCRTLDGLGMLVRQGAASFRIWTGVEPDLEAMFAALPGGVDSG
ncbi:MAG TPA: shikimate dehydrogenase [Sumerlaeia bacterium]|nr:shikimate dehydrogenase [Sumerlaeia bacterium]